MIKVALTKIHTKIKIHGLLSDLFTLRWGVRQGYQQSILLYIIAAEVLINFIGIQIRIKGTEIGDHVIEKVNFADLKIKTENFSFLEILPVLTGYK